MNFFEYQERKESSSKPMLQEEDLVEFPPITVTESEMPDHLRRYFDNCRIWS
jgi:hypothetical protein